MATMDWILNRFKTKQEPVKEPDFSGELNKEDPVPVGNSLINTVAPTAFGINRKLVLAAGGIFCAVIIGSFIFNINSDAPSTKKVTDNKKTVNSGVEQMHGGIADSMPNSYGDLAKYNTTAKSGNPPVSNTNRMNAANGMANGTPSVPNDPPQVTPRYSPSTPPVAPYVPTIPPSPYVSPTPDQNAQVKTAQATQPTPDVAEWTKSAIRFTMAVAASNTQTPLTPVQASSNTTTTVASNTPSSDTSSTAGLTKPDYVVPVDNELMAGTVIPATLLTGLDSDIPGQVIAQVRQNVYDTVTGQSLLIPQGSKLLGEYGGKVGVGQERIGVVWKRMILPNGMSLDLGGMAAIDTAGYTGLKDKVDNHEGRIIGTTLISSLLSAGAQIAAGNNNSGTTQTNGQLAVSGAAQSLMNAGTKLLERDLAVAPTIRIRPGTLFDVFINRDFVLQPYSL